MTTPPVPALPPPPDAIRVGGRASCHPRRRAVTDSGLCKLCAGEARKLLAEQQQYGRIVRYQFNQAMRTVNYIKGLAARAEAMLQDALPRYATLHLEGAERAAADGDTRPAEWALTHIPATGGKPVVRGGDAPGGGEGIKVLIGVQVGGVTPTETIDVRHAGPAHDVIPDEGE